MVDDDKICFYCIYYNVANITCKRYDKVMDPLKSCENWSFVVDLEKELKKKEKKTK